MVREGLLNVWAAVAIEGQGAGLALLRFFAFRRRLARLRLKDLAPSVGEQLFPEFPVESFQVVVTAFLLFPSFGIASAFQYQSCIKRHGRTFQLTASRSSRRNC
jgi:hypothetical protein